MIKAGTFRARAVEGDLGIAQTGKEQVHIKFCITSGPDEGQHVIWFGYFNSPENAKRTLESLRFCGWAGTDISDLTGIDANEVEVVVEQEEYNGKTRAKVRWINEIGGGPSVSKRMTDVQRQAFAARMKGLAMATRPTEPKKRDYPDEWDKS